MKGPTPPMWVILQALAAGHSVVLRSTGELHHVSRLVVQTVLGERYECAQSVLEGLRRRGLVERCAWRGIGEGRAAMCRLRLTAAGRALVGQTP